MSAIHQLAHLFLRDGCVQRWPQIDDRARDLALAACGIGCDHLDGEELVAIIDDTQREGVFTGAVITSRRYAWRNMTAGGQVLWADLASVRAEKGVLITKQRCVLLRGEVVVVPPTSADTTAFFDAVVRLPAAARVGSAHRLPRGRMSAQRTISDLSAKYGRGQHFGTWVSACAPSQLTRAFELLLGTPFATGAHGEHQVCDFELSSAWQALMHLDATKVHRDTLHAAGYARKLEWLRVVVKPLWPGSAFTVHGLQAGAPALPLCNCNPALLTLVHAELLRIESQLLAAPRSRPSAPAHV